MRNIERDELILSGNEQRKDCILKANFESGALNKWVRERERSLFELFRCDDIKAVSY